MAHLSRWLEAEGLAPAGLTAVGVGRFVKGRRAAGYRRWVTVRALRQQLGFLRPIGVIPQAEAEQVEGPVERVVGEFGGYLRRERRWANATVRQRVDVVRKFLQSLPFEDGLRLDRLDASAVIGFILRESHRSHSGVFARSATTAARTPGTSSSAAEHASPAGSARAPEHPAPRARPPRPHTPAPTASACATAQPCTPLSSTSATTATPPATPTRSSRTSPHPTVGPHPILSSSRPALPAGKINHEFRKSFKGRAHH